MTKDKLVFSLFAILLLYDQLASLLKMLGICPLKSLYPCSVFPLTLLSLLSFGLAMPFVSLLDVH